MHNRDELINTPWPKVVLLLDAGDIPVDLIGPAIVHVGKTEDAARLESVKNVISKYLDHTDFWARHEAMWFVGSWARFKEFRPKLEYSMLNDSDEDNRAFAAICLGRTFCGTNDDSVLCSLAGLAADHSQPDGVRENAFAAVLSVRYGEAAQGSASAFQLGDKPASEIDMFLLEDILRKCNETNP